jgi:hypothetical protein
LYKCYPTFIERSKEMNEKNPVRIGGVKDEVRTDNLSNKTRGVIANKTIDQFCLIHSDAS